MGVHLTNRPCSVTLSKNGKVASGTSHDTSTKSLNFFGFSCLVCHLLQHSFCSHDGQFMTLRPEETRTRT